MTKPVPDREQPDKLEGSPSAVYFGSIEIENVLCFKTRQSLDLCDAQGFPAQWTVILGDNGVGKTTLLRCLAMMRIQNFRGNSLPADFFTLDGHNNRRSERHLLFSAEKASLKVDFVCGDLGNDDCNFSGELQRYQMLYDPGLAESHYIPEFPCYGYGASRKMGETSLSEILSSKNVSTLFWDSETLINAEEWLLQADYAVARSDDSSNQFEMRFNLVKETLNNLLPDIDDIRIAPATTKKPRPTAEFSTPYGWVSLFSLGLGYRTVIAWVVDLAARMMDYYPDSSNPLAEPAVVLVDEIDLHLHPKWQRTIMSFLTTRFPKVQFIVTAHSPLVVQAARNANLVLLRREGDHVVIDNNPEVIENWRVEQVLTSVFELPSTFPADIEPLMQRRREILAKSTLTKKDKKELQELELKIGNLPMAESAADIQAMDIIRKAAQLLEKQQSS
jgi:predicted ATP-binding protein involved in virulence